MILNLRVDHKIANIDAMENIAKEMDQLFLELQEKYSIVEYVEISTCNRKEYYIHNDNIDASDSLLSHENKSIIIDYGDSVIKHLFRMTSGLESMIVGEDQILGQVSDAKQKAFKERHCGKILAEKHLGNLENKSVLVIGAGKMGKLVAKALAEKNLNAIFVANRTYYVAVELANDLNGHAVLFNELGKYVQTADLIISATGAPHYILNKERLEKTDGDFKDLLMIDIANPRDICEDVCELGVKLFNIDDLREIADENTKLRKKEFAEAENIIDEEFSLLKESFKLIGVEDIIANLRVSMEKIRERETEKAIAKLSDVDANAKIIDNLTNSIVNKIFFDISKKIKQAAHENDEELIRAIEFMFEEK